MYVTSQTIHQCCMATVLNLHLHLTCRKCDTEEETSAHILCECEALASLRHTHLGSFFLDPEDIRVLGMGVI